MSKIWIESLEKGEIMIKKVTSDGAKVICTPEGYLDGYPIGNMKKKSYQKLQNRLKRISETTERYYVEKICSLAKKLSACLLVGLSEMSNGNLYNSVTFIDPDGSILGIPRAFTYSARGNIKKDQGRHYSYHRRPSEKHFIKR